MTKEELDNLWELYREFCLSINVTAVYVPDFLAWIERRKMIDGILEQIQGKDIRCACGKEWKHPGKHDEPIVS